MNKNKFKMISMIIRILLSLLLIGLSYKETGIFTAINFFLIFTAFELKAIIK